MAWTVILRTICFVLELPYLTLDAMYEAIYRSWRFAMRILTAIFLYLLTGGGVSIAHAQYQLLPVHHGYRDGVNLAVSQSRPIVVWVGCTPMCDIHDAVMATTTFLDGYPAQCIVVAAPRNGSIIWKETLLMTASKDAIEKAVRPAMADPFRSFQPASIYQQSLMDCSSGG